MTVADDTPLPQRLIGKTVYNGKQYEALDCGSGVLLLKPYIPTQKLYYLNTAGDVMGPVEIRGELDELWKKRQEFGNTYQTLKAAQAAANFYKQAGEFMHGQNLYNDHFKPGELIALLRDVARIVQYPKEGDK